MHIKQGKQAESVRTVDPKNEIARVIDAEIANLKTSKAALGARADLAGDILALYELVRRNVDTSIGSMEEHKTLMVMLALLAGCRAQMTMGVLQNWRGRASEALGSLRRASELCGAACHIRRNPNLADVWLNASENDEAYKKHKEAFSIKAIFPKSDSVLHRLYEVFDFASKGIHVSIYSLASQISGGTFLYFDIKGPHDPQLIRTFIYILSAHELILRSFITSFNGALRDTAVVEKEFKLFAERLQRHREVTREFAMSDLRQKSLLIGKIK
jgi:hypothetical protein